MVERALLKIGRMCTSDCIFCHANGPEQDIVLPLREVCRRILRVRDAGFGSVVLSGGEPTAHPDFLTIAKFVKRSGLSLGLITNGRALAKDDLVGALLLCGLEYVNVSLHGPDSKTHDGLAGVASFDSALQSIETLAGYRKVFLSVTTVVARPNLSALDHTVGLVTSLLADSKTAERPNHRLALIEPKGRAARDRSLLPDPSEAARSIEEALKYGVSLHESSIARGADGLPMCLEPLAQSSPQDLRSHGITSMQEVHERKLYSVDHGRRSYVEGCRECVERESCPGLFEGYLPEYSHVLTPFTDHHDP